MLTKRFSGFCLLTMLCLVAGLLAACLLTACTPASPPAIKPVGGAAVPLAAVPAAKTPTLAPVNTLAPTGTPDIALLPTQAPLLSSMSGPLVSQGIKSAAAWCLALDAAVSYAKNPLNPPKNARVGKVGENFILIRNMPSNGCIFSYTFAQAAPAGLKLELSELKGTKPFFTTALQPSTEKAEVVYAFLRHGMVITPPGDGINLLFVVKDSLGQVLRRDEVSLRNWIPGTPPPRQEDDKVDCGCTVTIP